MSRIKDISNQRFGKLTAISYVELDKHSNALWLFLCDCGQKVVKIGSAVRNGHIQSCGCLPGGYEAEDLTGKNFGRLTVLQREGKDKWRTSTWKCICECGKTSIVRKTALSRGHIKSCGCLHQETVKEYKGSNNPNYNPELSDTDRILKGRSTGDMDSWIKTIKFKYDYKCAICGTGESIVAHHIYGFAEYKELRTDIRNGICLCRECHNDFHSNYGTKHVDAFQLIEFILERTKNEKIGISANS